MKHRGLFMSLQLCLFGHEKALSFHAAISLSKVKGGFTGRAEQIADGSSHLRCQVTLTRIALSFKSYFFFCIPHTAKASRKHKVNVVKAVNHRAAQVGKDLRRSSGPPFGGKSSLDEIT